MVPNHRVAEAIGGSNDEDDLQARLDSLKKWIQIMED
jgi:hypothetical protein